MTVGYAVAHSDAKHHAGSLACIPSPTSESRLNVQCRGAGAYPLSSKERASQQSLLEELQATDAKLQTVRREDEARRSLLQEAVRLAATAQGALESGDVEAEPDAAQLWEYLAGLEALLVSAPPASSEPDRADGCQ